MMLSFFFCALHVGNWSRMRDYMRSPRQEEACQADEKQKEERKERKYNKRRNKNMCERQFRGRDNRAHTGQLPVRMDVCLNNTSPAMD